MGQVHDQEDRENRELVRALRPLGDMHRLLYPRAPPSDLLSGRDERHEPTEIYTLLGLGSHVLVCDFYFNWVFSRGKY